MIQITCKESIYTYDTYHIIKAFFPETEIRQRVDQEQESLIEIHEEGGSCSFRIDKGMLEGETLKEQKRSAGRVLYRQLVSLTGKELPWGILTGIRPTKIISRLLEGGNNDSETVKYLRENYHVSGEKAKLGIRIARTEKSLLQKLDYQKGYSLYIGIPFCPTTCSYCSFTSYPIQKWQKRMKEYLNTLIKEITYIAQVMKTRYLNTIYIGGGTPTTLEPAELELLLDHLRQHFDMEHLIEFTVEAGRPDSITADKLRVLYKYGVTRISINPQTMQQQTLDMIGRNHTVQQVVDTYHMAREQGFRNINMDLIAGLPGERINDVEDSLNKLKELAPDSLTIHALAIKRAAKLGQENYSSQINAGELAAMIEMGGEKAGEMGMIPYYLYRQKNIAGSFENVGYAKVDKAGIYNILIMEEVQSIIAAGAGVITKVKLSEPIIRNQKVSELIRLENVKDIEGDITRIDEMIERKEEWLWR